MVECKNVSMSSVDVLIDIWDFHVIKDTSGAVQIDSVKCHGDKWINPSKMFRHLAYKYGAGAMKRAEPVYKTRKMAYNNCIMKHSCYACADSKCTARTMLAK